MFPYNPSFSWEMYLCKICHQCNKWVSMYPKDPTH